MTYPLYGGHYHYLQLYLLERNPTQGPDRIEQLEASSRGSCQIYSNYIFSSHYPSSPTTIPFTTPPQLALLPHHLWTHGDPDPSDPCRAPFRATALPLAPPLNLRSSFEAHSIRHYHDIAPPHRLRIISLLCAPIDLCLVVLQRRLDCSNLCYTLSRSVSPFDDLAGSNTGRDKTRFTTGLAWPGRGPQTLIN